MKKVRISEAKPDEEGFAVLGSTARSQVAVIVLEAGKATGGVNNRHPSSDQCLYVVSGQGEAIITGKHISLEQGALVLIEAGEEHELRNTGAQPLVSLNFYAPPAFSPESPES